MEINLLTPLDLEKFEHLFPPYLLKELPGDEILLGCVNEEPLDAAGILMAHPEAGELFVDWLYVDEAYRRKGAASQMLELLLDVVEATDELDAVTLIFSEQHEHMDELLEARGFGVFKREGDKGFLTTLGKFPKLPAKDEPVGEILPLSQAGEQAIRSFAGLIDDAVIPGVAIETPLDLNQYLPESCILLEDGMIRGTCLLEENDEGLSIAWIYNNCPSPDNIIHIVNESIRLLKEKYPEDTPLSFASVNPGVERIIERRVPVDSRAEIYVGTFRFDLDA